MKPIIMETSSKIQQYFVTVDKGVWDETRKVVECSSEQEMDDTIASWKDLAWSQRNSITKVFIEIDNIDNNAPEMLSKLNKKILKRVSFRKKELEGTAIIKKLV